MRWLLLLVPVGALVGAWIRHRRHGARQRQLMLLCHRAGLGFSPLDLRSDTAWLPFAIFGRSPSGTENVVWDERVGTDVYAFDFWYEEDADDRPVGVRRRLTCAVVPLPTAFPGLRVVPRDATGALGEAIRGSEVTLELEDFTRRFVVEAEDRRAAVAFLDQRMMEAFLGLPEDVTAEVSEDVLLLSAPLLPPPQVLLLFDAACRLQRRIPPVITSLFPPRPSQGAFEHRWLQGRWSPDATGADVWGRAPSA
jgi:hypothetical protein